MQEKKILFSTKGPGMSSTIGVVLLGIVLFVLGFIMAVTIEVPPRYVSKNTELTDTILQIMPFLVSGVGLLCIGISIIASKTYLEVYDDHVEGKAFLESSWNCNDFYLTYDKINNVTVGRIKNAIFQFNGVFIHTDSGVYKIAASTKVSSEIFRYFNSRG